MLNYIFRIEFVIKRMIKKFVILRPKIKVWQKLVT